MTTINIKDFENIIHQIKIRVWMIFIQDCNPLQLDQIELLKDVIVSMLGELQQG